MCSGQCVQCVKIFLFGLCYWLGFDISIGEGHWESTLKKTTTKQPKKTVPALMEFAVER